MGVFQLLQETRRCGSAREQAPPKMRHFGMRGRLISLN